MSRRDFAVVACRFLGLYVLLRSFDSLGAFVELVIASFGSEQDAASLANWYAVSYVLYILSGVLLLTFAEYVGTRMARIAGAPADLPASDDRVGWTAALAFTLLGLFDLLTSVPALVERSVQLLASRNKHPWENDFPPFGISFGALALRVGFGLWLVLGARGWARALHYLRGRGLQPGERPWENLPPRHDEA